MKKVFIYYSLTGNSDKFASHLKKKNYEIRKIETKEQLPKNFLLRILTGGYKAMINYEDKLIDFNKNLEKYDEIIIGSPIWNRRLAAPINTVLKEANIETKKVIFILYSGSNKIDKAKQIINKTFKDAKIINLIEPKKNKEELSKIFDI